MQIFENGIFISCEDKNKLFSVLIEDRGHILFTGDFIPEQYRNTQNRIDIKGQTVVPAFADTHMHFSSFCFFLDSIDVRIAGSFDDLADIIRRYENINPDAKIILGFGCSAHIVREKKLPDKELLDKITSRPLMLIKYDGHASVANTSLIRTLPEMVTQDSGFNEKSGWLTHLAYYKAVNHITKSVPLYRLLKSFIKGANILAENGVGLVHTVEGLGFTLDADVDLMRLASMGLNLNFRIYFQTMNTRKVVRRKLKYIGGCFDTALDGSFGSEDSALIDPYTHNPENRGMLVYSQKQVNNFVMTANRLGLQVALHATGDAAVKQAIIAYEAALEDFRRTDHRHVIIHANLIPPDLLERAKNIGLHLAVQPSFLYWEEEPMEYLVSILGNRAADLIPLRSIIESGIITAGGSDAPCTPPNPIQGIYAACNHPNPDQRISAIDALRMYTNWAARLSFDEEQRGTLTAGKLADLAVLDKNPLTLATDKIREINVTKLYIKGIPYSKNIKTPLDLCKNAIKHLF